MNKKATEDEWQKLYTLALKYQKKEPWKTYRDTDLFYIRFSPEDTGYFTILGRGGACIGCNLFLGEEGFQDIMGIIHAEELELPIEYIMREQNCISMFIDDPAAIPQEQCRVIRSLGPDFCGENEWIYFESYEKGCFPCLPSGQEVQIYTKYLEQLLKAIDYIEEHSCKVNFDYGEIFEYFLENGNWKGNPLSIVECDYILPQLQLADEIQILSLKKAAEKKNKEVLELDMFYTDLAVTDERSKKKRNQKIAVMVNHNSCQIVSQHLIEPQEDDRQVLPSILADWIMNNGAPAGILVENRLVEALVRSVCEMAGIPLQIASLEGVEQFRNTLFEEEFDENDLESMLGGVDLLEAMSDFGLDMDTLTQMASSMSKEEFLEGTIDQMVQAMEKVGYSQEDLEGLLDGEEAEDYTQLELKNRKQKEDVVKDFLGQRKEADEIYKDYTMNVVIGCSDHTWTKCLEEGTKTELLKLARNMGAKVDNSFSKDMLSSIIISKEVMEPGSLNAILGEEAAGLLCYLQKKSKAESNVLDLAEFPYSAEAVLKLLSTGQIDIGYAWSDSVVKLEINVIQEAI